MSFVALAACLTLFAYGVAVSVGTPLALLFLNPALRIADPVVRSRRLVVLRLLPAAFALVVSVGAVLPALLWFEPRSTGERLGPGLLVVTALSATFGVWGIARGAASACSTRQLLRRWRPTARPIRLPGIAIPAFSVDESFPIVAIAGCIRPRLFVSRIVLDRCSSDEVAAILAHESGHLLRSDPRIGLLLRACPDLLALTPLGGAIERRWAEAADQAADDYAAAAGRSRSLDLVSALLKVARLALAPAPHGLPMTALYRGGEVSRRAARLLARGGPPILRPRRRPATLLAATFGIGVLFCSLTAAAEIHFHVHRLVEVLVQGPR